MINSELKAELLSWFNQQMDLSSTQVDIVDGFVFMLRKIRAKHNLCLVKNNELHQRFWKAHNRAFGYQIRTKNDQHVSKQMQEFYWNIAWQEEFISIKKNQAWLTEKGRTYLKQSKEQQLEQILTHIW